MKRHVLKLARWPFLLWGCLIGIGLASAVYGFRHWLRIKNTEPEPPIAAAFRDDAPAWPPSDERFQALDPSIPAVEALTREPAPTEDAGDPLPEPRVDQAGIKARRGQLSGLHYLEVIFGDASFDDELPMVVVLHGRGGAARVPGGPFLQLPHPVRAVVPQAPDRRGQGFEWLPVYVGQGLIDRLTSSLFQTSGTVANFMRTAMSTMRTRGKPIVTGFSQGGMLTIALALHHDDVVGYALPLAGWIPPPLEPSYKRVELNYPPIVMLHGTVDTTIPFEPARLLSDRLHGLGFDVSFFAFEGVAHVTSAEQNMLFHGYLKRAVCLLQADLDCIEQADDEIERFTPRGASQATDAGLDGEVDGAEHAIDSDAAVSADAALDANLEASVLRRRQRRQ